MKKITLSVLALFVGVATSVAQVTLENNNGDNVPTGANSVGCPSGDNHWGRNIYLGDYNISGKLSLTHGTFGVQSVSADALVTVNVYASEQNFDEGTIALLGSQDVLVPATATAPGSIDFTFDVPVIVPAGTEAVFLEVESLSDTFWIAGTAGNKPGAESYLKSAACNVASYVTAASINFPDAHFYITVTGDEIVGINDNILASVSVYPNPTNGILNVQTPANVTVDSVALYDLLGKRVSADYSNSTIDMTSLSQGVYLLNVETSAGTLTQKVVKQ